MRKKTYRQDCSLAYAADLLGERWTLLIFRELLIRSCRFGELNQYLAGMGSNLLAARLKELEQGGLIKHEDAEKKRSPYLLTSAGREAEPLILELIRFGYRFAKFNDNNTHWHHWDLLAMKAFFVAGRCSDSLCVQFKCDELTAWVAVDSDGLSYAMGEDSRADVVLNYTIRALQNSHQAGSSTLTPQLRAFVDCFVLPSALSTNS